jgi:hypothetical protein
MIDRFARAGIYQDIPIWEHKKFRAHPVLVKGDGEIAEYRRWVAQFYSWPDDPAGNGSRPNGADANADADTDTEGADTQGWVSTNG